MNKTYLCVLPLTLFLAASSGNGVAQEPECEVDERPMPPCLGDPRVPTVNLNVKSKHVDPRCVRAHPGTTIVFTLTPKAHVELNTVEVFPKNDADDWLAGKNEVYKDIIIIAVPDEPETSEPETSEPEDTDHGYNIKILDECIDPRVHVER